MVPWKVRILFLICENLFLWKIAYEKGGIFSLVSRKFCYIFGIIKEKILNQVGIFCEIWFGILMRILYI